MTRHRPVGALPAPAGLSRLRLPVRRKVVRVRLMNGLQMCEDRRSAVEPEALILLPDTVEDVEDFFSQPGRYLVSLYAEPQRAA